MKHSKGFARFLGRVNGDEILKRIVKVEKERSKKSEFSESGCSKCGKSIEEAVKRGGLRHYPKTKKDEWVCYQCQDKEAFEYEKKVDKLLKDNKLFLKCPKCGKTMDIVFSYVCGCGGER